MTTPVLTVRVRCVEDGRAALAVGRELGRPVLLTSDRGAAGFAGAGWWAALAGLLRVEAAGHPLIAVLDCGDAAGQVLAALRAGITDIAFDGPDEVTLRLADMAAQTGTRLHPSVQGAADLRGSRDRRARLHQIAAEHPRSGEM